jgi:cytochrome c oxidase subunit 2
LLADSASTSAARADYLFLFLLAVALGFATLIAAVIFVRVIKYRRRVQHAVASSGTLRFQPVWAILALAATMVLFTWGALVYLQNTVPPANAMEMYVVGSRWMWKIQHPDGRRELNELHVPANRDIKLILSSEDVRHSLSIPAFRIQQEVIPGQDTVLWFRATRAGRYPLFCSEYSGPHRTQMNGTVSVLEPAEYETWLSGGVKVGAVTGKDLMQQFGCNNCHPALAPDLNKTFGRRVKLVDGRTIIADEPFLRDCIIRPSKQYVAGYPPIMPSFQGQIKEDQLIRLVEYIKSLNKGPAASEGSTTAPAQSPAQK